MKKIQNRWFYIKKEGGDIIEKSKVYFTNFRARPGYLAYLRPKYAKVDTDIVKELGGKPCLTDCNTL